jgi:hypothetical protein
MSMRIAISGSSGLIGKALTAHLEKDGHTCVKLVRGRSAAAGAIAWDPTEETIGALDGIDAVVHLAGENIGDGRWTDERKRTILESRVKGTRTIAKAVAARPSIALVSASAVGYYGDTQAEVDESSPRGKGFLGRLAAVALCIAASLDRRRRERRVRGHREPVNDSSSSDALSISARTRPTFAASQCVVRSVRSSPWMVPRVSTSISIAWNGPSAWSSSTSTRATRHVRSRLASAYARVARTVVPTVSSIGSTHR